MRFGLSLPHYGFSLPGGEPLTFEATAAWARRAEEAGFDSVSVSDHFFYSFGRYGADPAPIAALEPMTALAGLAAVTERVRLQTLVLCAPFRHPAILAKMAATIDLLSNGRLDLGLGAGWLEDEFTAFGYRFGSVGERFTALEETLAVLDALFASDGAPVTFAGPTVSLRDARLLPSPVQRPIPLWVGGKGGPRLLGLAARYAAGWNMVWRVAPSWYAERTEAIEAARIEAGRDPATFRRTIGLYAIVGEDEADARSAFERGRAAMPGGAMDGETYGSWCADTLSGTPDQVRERIEAFEALGVEEIVIAPWVLPFAVPEPRRFEVFAEQVLAPLRASGR
ncbi:MAG: LLM class flavin-dependent oxidoreductase [Actinomycetota bacterium]